MIKAGIIGLGKMGLSHQAILNVHPEIQLQAVSDASAYIVDVLSKYTGVKGYTNYRDMLAQEELDCVFVATPSRYHVEIVTAALERDLHVFCEKPFGLDPEAACRLAELAEHKHLVNQVGYHYRFVATFNEARRLLEREILGQLHHLRVEAYGPAVVRPQGSTWRSQKEEGGGCLFDYACHAIDLVNYLVGPPRFVSGTVLNSVFSQDVDDEIYSTLHFADGFQGQLATNWSDESYRKMSVRVGLWGTNGRINADRQEIQLYLRAASPADGLQQGWTVRYTTELTQPVWFYVRGEEYSAQIEHFVQCVKAGTLPISSFRTASDSTRVAAMLREDASRPRTAIELKRAPARAAGKSPTPGRRARSLVRTLFSRR